MNLPRRAVVGIVGLVLALLLSVRPAQAQEPDRSSFVADVLKQVALDPTTYAPAVLSYTGLRLDWRSSQVFFRHGFVEANRRYTVSGLPNDIPIGYGAGNRRLIADALGMLQMSLVNNATAALFEKLLARRYPEHRTLLRVLSWVERAAFAGYWSSRSSTHFHQWRENERLSRRLGYK